MNEFWKLYATIIGHEFNVSLKTIALVARLNKTTYEKVKHRLERCKRVYKKYERRLAFGYYIKLLNCPIYRPDLQVRTKCIPLANLMNNQLGIMPLFGVFDSTTHVPIITAIKVLLRAVTPVVTCLYIGREPVSTMYGRYISPTMPAAPGFGVGTGTLEIDYEKPGNYLMDLCIPFNFNPICIEDSLCPANAVHIAFNKYLTEQNIGDEIVYGLYHNTEFVIDHISHFIINYKYVRREEYDWSKYGIYTTSNLRNGMVMYSLVRDKYETAQKDHKNAAREQEKIDSIESTLNISK